MPTRRRTGGASSSRPQAPRPATLEGWICDPEKQAEFGQFWQERWIMGVKYVRLEYYKFYGFQFPNLFANQGLTNLVEQKEFMLTIWDDAVKIHLGVPKFNRLLAFQSFFRNPQQQLNRQQLLVGGFKVEERMIHYLKIWILCSRATNHAQYSKQDLLLIYGEHTQAIQLIGTKIGETTLRQMGFVAHGNVFLHKDEENQEDEDDDVDAHMAEPIREVAPFAAGPSTIPSSSSFSMEEYFANLSKQMEDMSLVHQVRFDELMEMHQTHHDYVCERFEDFDTRLGNIKDRLNLQPPDYPPTPPF
ncbi:hypothetical protein LR48_Vigan08g034700 [Vigna angularis]|uniref:Uncharacterized protein n=1 Tax=Phaseolus angularis TaxID=3914 RepID=A0A0L9V397_PHAAN|nr:hypothetical protein LR48_Vigan08g034700 [Vigna angularis]